MLIKSFLISTLLGAAATAAPQSAHYDIKRAQQCPQVLTSGIWALYANPWGRIQKGKPTTGQQCVTLDYAKGSEIGYHSDFSWDPKVGGVKAYANGKRDHNVQFRRLGGLHSTTAWDVNCQSDLGASIVYDLYGTFGRKNFEVMLWLGAPAGAHPIAWQYNDRGIPKATHPNVKVGNRWYDLYTGPNNGTVVYSFVVPGTLVEDGGVWTKYWAGNLKDFLQYLATAKVLGDEKLGPTAFLKSSSFGIEATKGQGCHFKVSKLIIKQS